MVTVFYPGALVSLRWPFKRAESAHQLVVSWSEGVLVYVLAHLREDGAYQVTQSGVEHQGGDSFESFVRRLQGLGLKGQQARAMLRPAQYQFIQIEAPAVPPEELRSAARYLIKDRLEAPLDELTLDVMRVGDGLQNGAGHLFVAAASNEMLKSIIELSDAMQWSVQIIDIGEASQRNIQLALAGREAVQFQGDVAFFFSDERQVLLTVSAHQELYYSRRLELPEGLFSSTQLSSSTPLLGLSDLEADPMAQRFVADIQRSLDALRRTWSSISTESMQVYAAQRSKEVSAWLGLQLGLKVDALDAKTLFSGFEDIASAHQVLCLPLLGALLRTESRVL